MPEVFAAFNERVNSIPWWPISVHRWVRRQPQVELNNRGSFAPGETNESCRSGDSDTIEKRSDGVTQSRIIAPLTHVNSLYGEAVPGL